MNLKSRIDELLEQLIDINNNPALFVCEYFESLKREIDIDVETYLMSLEEETVPDDHDHDDLDPAHENAALKDKANSIRNEMLALLKQTEDDCIEKLRQRPVATAEQQAMIDGLEREVEMMSKDLLDNDEFFNSIVMDINRSNYYLLIKTIKERMDKQKGQQFDLLGRLQREVHSVKKQLLCNKSIFYFNKFDEAIVPKFHLLKRQLYQKLKLTSKLQNVKELSNQIGHLFVLDGVFITPIEKTIVRSYFLFNEILSEYFFLDILKDSFVKLFESELKVKIFFSQLIHVYKMLSAFISVDKHVVHMTTDRLVPILSGYDDSSSGAEACDSNEYMSVDLRCLLTIDIDDTPDLLLYDAYDGYLTKIAEDDQRYYSPHETKPFDKTGEYHSTLLSNETELIEYNSMNFFKSFSILNLYANNLSTLNAFEFRHLKNLGELYLNDNSIQMLGKSTFFGLTNLIHLDLSNNDMSIIETGTFEHLKKLRSLNLSGNNISQVDHQMFWELTELDELFLTSNQLSKLHENQFKSQLQLKRLHLDRNKFSQLNGNLFEPLSCLEYLRLDQNELTTLNSSPSVGDGDGDAIFSSISNLKYLNLSHNKLKRLCKNQFKSQSQLVELYAQGNQIKHLDNGCFDSMVSLKYLDLDKNHLASIHGKFKSLKSIEYLSLANNHLTRFDLNDLTSQGSQPTKLKHLNLTGNPFNILKRFYYRKKYGKTTTKSDSNLTLII